MAVTVDLAGATFIDSTGLAVLVGARKRISRRGGALKLAAPSRTAVRVLELTALDRVFPIVAQP